MASFLKSIATQLSERWGPWFAVRLAWTRFREYSYWQHLGLLVSVAFALVGLWVARTGLTSDDAHPVATLPRGWRVSAAWPGSARCCCPSARRSARYGQSAINPSASASSTSSRASSSLLPHGDRSALQVPDRHRRPRPLPAGALRRRAQSDQPDHHQRGGAGRTFFVLGYDAKYLPRSINAALP